MQGLSRRGWIVIAGSAVALVIAFAIAAALLIGIPAGNAQAHGAPTPEAAWVPKPDAGLAPTPLGLPPRPTHTEVANEFLGISLGGTGAVIVVGLPGQAQVLR